jgi:hypothetical protein
MKVTFKDLKQQKFTLDVEPSELISAVKQKISAEKGWEPQLQKLIYSGICCNFLCSDPQLADVSSKAKFSRTMRLSDLTISRRRALWSAW